MHSYERGRLDLPFVGHCTFGKRPPCLDWDTLDADVAVLGVPFDMGTQYRAGARFGPRAIREASTLFSFGHGGAYDHEDDAVYLPMDKVRIVDSAMPTSSIPIPRRATAIPRRRCGKILERGAMPVVLGGDHAVNIPCIRAFASRRRSTSCRSTPISISSTCATACGRATATRCGGRPSRRM